MCQNRAHVAVLPIGTGVENRGHRFPRHRTRVSCDQGTKRFTDVELDRYSRDRDLQRRPVPWICAQILSDLEAVDAFSSLNRSLTPLAALRNLMAHEYPDVRFDRVKRFALAQLS